MKPVAVMINGLPGNVASMLAACAVKDSRFELINKSLTGPEISQVNADINGVKIDLIPPENRDKAVAEIRKSHKEVMAIDFTHPSAVNDNAEFYCQNQIPFVMGTTGGQRDKLSEAVEKSSVCAVIAPNMAKQIVGFQAMMAYAAENFPNLFEDYELKIEESHQKTKADTSGTAKAMVEYFNKLGIDFSQKDIIRVRDPEEQKNRLKVPEQYLSGHGWHTYTLLSPDKTVTFRFTHNVNGRDIYAQGTFDAVLFLHSKIKQGKKGQVFSMIDVLRNG